MTATRIRRVGAAAFVIVLSAGMALGISRALFALSDENSISTSVPKEAQTPAQERSVLDQPAEWVPFRAKIKVYSPGMARVEGRFFRAADGSQRVESGPPGEPPRTIDIRNIPERTNYLYMRGRWTSAPMDVDEWGGLKPLNRFADQKGLTKYPYLLSFRSGQEPSIFAKEGFEVYQFVDLGGNVFLQAPALNMYDLVKQSITGRREETYDVVMEDGDPGFFVPPPGAAVTHQSETRGMKIRPKSEHQPHK